jgi:hypothetical protein
MKDYGTALFEDVARSTNKTAQGWLQHTRAHSLYKLTASLNRALEKRGLDKIGDRFAPTGEKPLACDLCKYVAHNQANLARHLRAHAKPPQKNEKTIPCSLNCGKKFMSVDHRKRHESENCKNNVNRKKPPKQICKICGKYYAQLPSHMKLQHQGK